MKFQRIVYKGYFDSTVEFQPGSPITGTLIKETTHYVSKGAFTHNGLDGVGEFMSTMEHYMGYFSDGQKHGLGYTKRIGEKHNIIATYNHGVESGTAIEWVESGVVIRMRSDDRVQGYVRYRNGDIYIGDLREVSGDEDEGEEERGEGPRNLRRQKTQQIVFNDPGMIRTKFKRYSRHGFGTLYRASNDYYSGGWEFDQKSGIGLETLFDEPERLGDQPEKSNFYGHYSNNKRSGFGRLLVARGPLIEGNFARDSATGVVRVTQMNSDGSSGQAKYFLYHEGNKIGDATPDKISEFRKAEVAQNLFDPEDFRSYSLRKQTQLETKINQKKGELVQKFIQMSSILRENYELFKKIESESTQHFARRSRLTKTVEDIRLRLFKDCNDSFFAIVLKNPLKSLTMFQKSDDSVRSVEQTLQKKFFGADQSSGSGLLNEDSQKDSFVKGFLHLIKEKGAGARDTSPLRTMEIRETLRRESADKRDKSRNTKNNFGKEFPSYFTKLLQKNVKPNLAMTMGQAGDRLGVDPKSRSMITDMGDKAQQSKRSPSRSFVAIGSSKRTDNFVEAMTRNAHHDLKSASEEEEDSKMPMGNQFREDNMLPKLSLLKIGSARPRLNANDVINEMHKKVQTFRGPGEDDRSPRPSKSKEREEQRARIEMRKQSLSGPVNPQGLVSLDALGEEESNDPVFHPPIDDDTKREIEEAENSLLMQFMSAT
jgi:hypothetical protein